MTHISERCAPVPKKKSTGMSQRQSFLDRGVISENRAILRYNEELEREARQTERGETGPPDGGRREPGLALKFFVVPENRAVLRDDATVEKRLALAHAGGLLLRHRGAPFADVGHTVPRRPPAGVVRLRRDA